MKKLDIIVDMQFGSTGKGALAGYLSRKNNYYAVISVNMPNAGHTAYCPDTDKKFVHKVLPSGIFSKNLRVIGVGAGAVFNIDRLVEEWNNIRDSIPAGCQLVVHEAAGVLLPHHKQLEQNSLSRISSTMQGSAEAMISRIRREEGSTVKYFAESLRKIIPGIRVVNNNEWLTIFQHMSSILLEGSQGYSLGISAGFYPFCTSRDCTPARVMADAGMPLRWLRHTYGSARVHPIRVGNTPDGYSGDWYPDQRELTFEELGVEAEKTTVTGRVRRIASFSRAQMWDAMRAILPDVVFLNFFQYDVEASWEAKGVIDSIASTLGCGGVTLAGYGPRPSEISGVRHDDK